jgi:serine/threonine-protein kinase
MPDSPPKLIDRLRESGLLDAGTVNELAQLPQAEEADPRPLGKILFDRGLLTRYQLNRLANGKAKDLIVGPYVILDTLGEGGMGVVYKAKHRHLSRVVALKVIRKEKLANPILVARFYQEVQAAGALQHPNIVVAFDANQVGNTHYLAMEFVDGIDLAKHIRSNGPPSVALACEYIRQAAIGLQHAHEKGMVHRDIKPHNLLLSSEAGMPRVKILDMGLARFEGQEQTSLTQTGQVVGTPDFIAPEQAFNAKKADIRSDIYSLGCTLFFILTGKQPFLSQTLTEALLKHQMDDPPPLASMRSDVPPALQIVLSRMMAKKPEARYQTPNEVANALAPFAKGETVAYIPPPPPPPSKSQFLESSDPWSSLDNEEDLVVTPQMAQATRTQNLPEKKGKPSATLIGALVGVTGIVFLTLLLGLVALFASGRPQQAQVEKEEPKKEEPPVSFTGVLKGHRGPVLDFAIARDNKTLASADFSYNRVHLWDLNTGAFLRELHGEKLAGSLAFSADGQRLFSGSEKAIHEWELSTGRELSQKIRKGVFLSSDSTRTAWADSLGKTSMLHLSDLQAAREFTPLRIDNHKDLHLAFTTEAQRLALCSSSGTLQIVEVPTSRTVHRFDFAPNERPLQFVWLPGGHRLLCGHADGTLREIEPESGKRTRLFGGKHTAAISAIAISHDGYRALTGGKDNIVRLWDVRQGKEMARFEAHTKPITSVIFTNNGKRGISGSEDTTIHVWDLAQPTATSTAPEADVTPVALKELNTRIANRVAADANDSGV